MNIFARFMKDESGATAIEYGLIAALVGVSIIVALQDLSAGLNTILGTVATTLTSV